MTGDIFTYKNVNVFFFVNSFVYNYLFVNSWVKDGKELSSLIAIYSLSLSLSKKKYLIIRNLVNVTKAVNVTLFLNRIKRWKNAG